MKTEATFDGFSSITFDELGMRVHVSRKHGTAGVFRLTGESLGALMRKPDIGSVSCLNWASCRIDGPPCPMPIFEVVCTMI